MPDSRTQKDKKEEEEAAKSSWDFPRRSGNDDTKSHDPKSATTPACERKAEEEITRLSQELELSLLLSVVSPRCGGVLRLVYNRDLKLV